MSTNVDEYTQVYRAIRSGLLGFAGFAALVKPGNFYDLTDATRATGSIKPEIGPGDTPEVALVQAQHLYTPFGRNSRTSEAQQAYTLITTHDVGAYRLAAVNALKRQAERALTALGPHLGLPSIVRDWHCAAGADDVFGGGEWKRGSVRWTSVTTVNVVLYFPR